MPEGALWVRLPRFIGDAVMITQAVAPLQGLGLPLVAWGPPPVVELFEGSEPYVAAMADPEHKLNASAMAAQLKAQRAGGVINLPRSLRATLAARLAGLPLRVGWSPWLAAFLATHRLDYGRLHGNQLERYRLLLRKAFPSMDSADLAPFRPRPAALARAEELLRPEIGASPYAVLALGAMSWSKRLGDDQFVEAALFLQESGYRVVLLGAPGEDQAHGATIQRRVPGALDLTGQTPLSVAAGILAGSSVALGNDSALAHLAAACGVPVVVVFGPTDPAMTSPTGPWVRVVRDESLHCLVCQKGACPLAGHPCMNLLDPALIKGALGEALIAGVPIPLVSGAGQ
jgi:heptosyltransferase II